MRIHTVLATTIATLGLLGQVTQAGADLLAERKASLQAMKEQMATMRGALGDEQPAAVGTAADRIAVELERAIKLFPADSRDLAGTSALPEIWGRWDEFVQLTSAAIGAARGIQAAAATGALDDAAQDFRMLGEACNACHKQFRAR
jgi:cytochrome c556